MLGSHLTSLLYTHVIATSIMVGLIWFVQLVHYPSFHYIDRDRYSSFHSFHTKSISKIVVPVMLLESVTAMLLLYGLQTIEALLSISFVILIIIWIVTGIFFTRTHRILLMGYNKNIINRMVGLNWIRTILWSIRLVFLFIFLQ